MVLSQTKKYAVGSLIFFLLSAGLAGATVFFVTMEGAKLDTQMEVIGKHTVMKERYDALESAVAEHHAEHQQLASLLLTEGKTINFLNDIETLARQMGLTYTTDSLNVQPLPNPQFKTIELRLRADGPQDTIMAFLSVLESLPYFSRVSQLELKAEPGGEVWSAQIALIIGLTAYDE